MTHQDQSNTIHRRFTESLPREHPGFLESRIPFASEVEKMGLAREPLGRYAPRSRAARAFEDLWREIGARASKGPPGEY